MENIDFDHLSRSTYESGVDRAKFDELFKATFGLNEWLFIARGEGPNYNPYIASHPGTADGQNMVRAFTDGKRLHRFAMENALIGPDGNALILSIPVNSVVEYLEQFEEYGVYGVWFNSDLESDGYFVPLKQLRVIKHHLDELALPADVASARHEQDDLADMGVSKNEAGEIDVNVVINKVGVITYDPTIAPFRDALAAGLVDYQGTNDYVTLLAFDPSGVSDLTQDVISNQHGPYLQTRSFKYLNPKNGVHIDVDSVHSNSLRNIRSGAEVMVSVELCRDLDNGSTILYHRFEGPRSKVLELSTAFDTILEKCGYDPVG